MTARRFAGRRALVTGASRGIGAGIAERLAAEGADVVVVARTLDSEGHRLGGSLVETQQRLARYGTRVEVLAADITDDVARQSIVDRSAELLGGHVEILVNNAAAAMYAPVSELPLRRRRLMFEANVHAPLDLAQAAIPGMVAAEEGWIVNLSSGSARPWPGPPFELGVTGTTITAYGASKAALNRMSNGLAAELHGTGVRVNTIEPRAAVMSEGAAELVGGLLRPEQVESMEQMVEAVVALCDCPVDVTGGSHVSLDLLAAWGLTAHGLDGSPPTG